MYQLKSSMTDSLCSVLRQATVISSAWNVVKSTALVSTTQRKAAITTCLLTFLKQKESPDKLTSIVEEARVAVGNESSTVPLVLNAIFLEEMSVPRSYSIMEACPNANILVLHPTWSWSSLISFWYIVFSDILLVSDGLSLLKSNQTKRVQVTYM